MIEEVVEEQLVLLLYLYGLEKRVGWQQQEFPLCQQVQVGTGEWQQNFCLPILATDELIIRYDRLQKEHVDHVANNGINKHSIAYLGMRK